MTPEHIKARFPNASKSLLAVNAEEHGPHARTKRVLKQNETHDHSKTSGPITQPALRDDALATDARKAGDPARVLVRVTSYRRRLLDADNLCPKYFVDCLRYGHLIVDDNPQEIELAVAQIKVAHRADEKTEIVISTPDL